MPTVRSSLTVIVVLGFAACSNCINPSTDTFHYKGSLVLEGADYKQMKAYGGNRIFPLYDDRGRFDSLNLGSIPDSNGHYAFDLVGDYRCPGETYPQWKAGPVTLHIVGPQIGSFDTTFSVQQLRQLTKDENGYWVFPTLYLRPK